MKPDFLANGDYVRIAEPFWSPVRVSSTALRGRDIRLSPVKRAFDICVAASALLVVLPTMLIVAVLIKLDSAGPVFFRQRRSGGGGKVFDILKFRSMRVLENGDDVRQAVRSDDRVTRIGAFLRRTSMDELPQLINVLRGEMSIVGPRPHAVAHDRHFGALIANYNCRFMAKPGLTGLAQIRGQRGQIHMLSCMEARVMSDVEYIETWSLLHDLSIIIRTVPALASRAAY